MEKEQKEQIKSLPDDIARCLNNNTCEDQHTCARHVFSKERGFRTPVFLNDNPGLNKETCVLYYPIEQGTDE